MLSDAFSMHAGSQHLAIWPVPTPTCKPCRLHCSIPHCTCASCELSFWSFSYLTIARMRMVCITASQRHYAAATYGHIANICCKFCCGAAHAPHQIAERLASLFAQGFAHLYW